MFRRSLLPAKCVGSRPEVSQTWPKLVWDWLGLARVRPVSTATSAELEFGQELPSFGDLARNSPNSVHNGPTKDEFSRILAQLGDSGASSTASCLLGDIWRQDDDFFGARRASVPLRCVGEPLCTPLGPGSGTLKPWRDGVEKNGGARAEGAPAFVAGSARRAQGCRVAFDWVISSAARLNTTLRIWPTSSCVGVDLDQSVLRKSGRVLICAIRRTSPRCRRSRDV